MDELREISFQIKRGSEPENKGTLSPETATEQLLVLQRIGVDKST